MKKLGFLLLLTISSLTFAQDGRVCRKIIINFKIETSDLTLGKCRVIVRSTYGMELAQQNQPNGVTEEQWWDANVQLCNEEHLALREANMMRAFCIELVKENDN